MGIVGKVGIYEDNGEPAGSLHAVRALGKLRLPRTLAAGGLLAVLPLLLIVKIVCGNVLKLQKPGKAMAG